MRALMTLAILLLLAPAAVYGQAQNPFEHYIAFYVPIGEKPKMFASFANFAITSASAEKITGRVIPMAGAVFEFTSASITNGAMRFTTRRVKGMSYQFAGRLLKAPPFPDDGKTAVLEGVLKRFRHGHLEAQATLRFMASAGGDE